MPQHLPSRPNLDHLKKQATDVLRLARHQSLSWRLTDAQHAVAREYGFDSWPMLKRHVESEGRPRRTGPSAQPREERTAESNQAAVTIVWEDDGRPVHPLAGAWVMRHSTPSEDHAPSAIDDMLVEFALHDGAIALTQIVGRMENHPNREADLRAIEAINQKDMQFALANDLASVTVLGDHAFQWGTYHYRMRPRGGGETVRTAGKIMRILRRQADGAWKIYRGISTVDPPAPQP